MKTRSAAVEYANIFYLVCKEQNVIDEVLYNLKSLRKLDSELKETFLVPTISKDVRKAIISELKEIGFMDEVLNLLKVLIDSEALNLFGEILDEFENIYQEENKILIVHATVAQELSDERQDMVHKNLEAKLNCFVVVIYTVDKSIIGGIKFDYNGYSVNNTIKKQLSVLKNIY